jgi:uncharacterized protein HemX
MSKTMSKDVDSVSKDMDRHRSANAAYQFSLAENSSRDSSRETAPVASQTEIAMRYLILVAILMALAAGAGGLVGWLHPV